MHRLRSAAVALLCALGIAVSLPPTVYAQRTTVTASALQMGGIPIPAGTVTFTPTNGSNYAVPVTGADGTLSGPQGFAGTITAGAITGTYQVPDECLSNATVPNTPLFYRVDIYNSAPKGIGNPYGGYTTTLTGVTGVCGATFALDHYVPVQHVSIAPAGLFTGSVPPARCTSPAVFYRTIAPYDVQSCIGSVFVPPASTAPAVNLVTGTTAGQATQYSGKNPAATPVVDTSVQSGFALSNAIAATPGQYYCSNKSLFSSSGYAPAFFDGSGTGIPATGALAAFITGAAGIPAQTCLLAPAGAATYRAFVNDSISGQSGDNVAVGASGWAVYASTSGTYPTNTGGSSGGAVTSVNAQTGDVVLTAASLGPEPATTRLTALGDSTTYGQGMSSPSVTSWPAILKTFGYWANVTVVNAGVSGDTCSGATTRYTNSIQPNKPNGGSILKHYLVLMIGRNDLSSSRTCIDALIKQANADGFTTVLSTVLPSSTLPAPAWFTPGVAQGDCIAAGWASYTPAQAAALQALNTSILTQDTPTGNADPATAPVMVVDLASAIGDPNVQGVTCDGTHPDRATTYRMAQLVSARIRYGVPLLPMNPLNSATDPVFSGNVTSRGVLGPATAPTGTCSVAGAWVLSQDGHASYCPSAGGTWTSKL